MKQRTRQSDILPIHEGRLMGHNKQVIYEVIPLLGQKFVFFNHFHMGKTRKNTLWFQERREIS